MRKLNLLLDKINSGKNEKHGTKLLNFIIKSFGDILAKDYVILINTQNEDAVSATANIIYEKGLITSNSSLDFEMIIKDIEAEGKLMICKQNTSNVNGDSERSYSENFAGIPIWSSKGSVIGILALADRMAIPDDETDEIETMLKFVSAYLAQSMEMDIMSKHIELHGEKQFADLILNIFPGLFFVYDISEGFENASLLRFNKRWYIDKLGYGVDDIPGSYPYFFFSPADNEITKGVIQELSSYKYADCEIGTCHKEGYEIPYLYVFNLFTSGNHTYFIGFGIDISERKYVESALMQSEQYFKNIFNSSTDGILVMDLDFKLLNANKAIFRMFDYKFEDIAFQNVLDFLPPSTRPTLESRMTLLGKNETLSPIEIEIMKRTGELIPIEINSILIQYGEREGILTTVRDLTERKMYEKRIFNSEIYSEEKERERFAKELHDGMGPILSTCKIYLHSLNEMLDGNREVLSVSNRALTLLDDALGSIKEISNNLSPHVLRNFGLVHAVISFTHNIESLSTLNFEVHYNYDKRLDEVVEFTVYRILTELINNTLKYAEATLVVIEIYLNEPSLKVTYSDNGKGFELEDTKKLNKGFGLINIENRVTKFNGSFSYKTSPGKGVKVEFALDSNHPG